MNDIKIVKSSPVEPGEESWLEHLRKTEQEIPNRIEDAAKYLATMIAVSFSFLLGTDKPVVTGATEVKIKVAVVLWLAALLLSFFVLFPFRYKVFSNSIDEIKKMLRTIAVVKRTLLILSLLFFLFALMIFAAVNFF